MRERNRFRPRRKRFRRLNLDNGQVRNISLPETTPDSKDVVYLQNTGLRDRNGKEIYEGDILQILGARPILVESIDGEWKMHKVYGDAEITGNYFNSKIKNRNGNES